MVALFERIVSSCVSPVAGVEGKSAKAQRDQKGNAKHCAEQAGASDLPAAMQFFRRDLGLACFLAGSQERHCTVKIRIVVLRPDRIRSVFISPLQRQREVGIVPESSTPFSVQSAVSADGDNLGGACPLSHTFRIAPTGITLMRNIITSPRRVRVVGGIRMIAGLTNRPSGEPSAADLSNIAKLPHSGGRRDLAVVGALFVRLLNSFSQSPA